MYRTIALVLSLSISPLLFAKQCVEIQSTNDLDVKHGEICFENSPLGLMIHPQLRQLPPGPHGLHIHSKPSCANSGHAAGGHFDPKNAGKHLGPYAAGHLGDLPVLFIGIDGTAHTPLLAPRLRLNNLQGRSVMIHSGGDNYSDTPIKLGGGGKRIACGVIGTWK